MGVYVTTGQAITVCVALVVLTVFMASLDIMVAFRLQARIEKLEEKVDEISGFLVM